MSALPGDHFDSVDSAGIGQGEAVETPALEAAPEAVTVRRNAALSAVVGVAASALAVAYLWRAIQYAAPLDWVLCVIIAGVAGYHLSALLDARTPLVVADDLGVRIRLGSQWRGLPWDAVARVEALPRTGLFRDGRLAFHPHHVERALDGLDTPGRRAARMNERLHGAPLVVPLGLTTRASVPSGALDEALTRLGAATVTPDSATAAESAESTESPESPESTESTGSVDFSDPTATVDSTDPTDSFEEAAERAPRRSPLGGLGTLVSRFGHGRGHDVDEVPVNEGDTVDAADPFDEGARDITPEPAAPKAPAAFAVPLREARRGLRAMVTRDHPATPLGAAALHEEAVNADLTPGDLPEARALRRPGSVDLDVDQGPAVHLLGTPGEPDTTGHATVHPIARPGKAVEPRDAPAGFTRSIDPLALARLNDDAYGMRSAFARALVNLEAGDGLYLYGVEEDGELASGLVTFDHGDDCSVWLVATRERSRGRGLAGALLSHALADARERGRTTSTLQATDLGRPVYERLGYRSLGEIQLWEKRRSGG